MNRFVKNKSTAFLLLSWFFLAALVADSVNISDIFVPTEHFEECYAPQTLDTISPQLSVDISSPVIPQHSGFTGQKTIVLKKVLLDQDSPALSAVTFTSSHCFNLTPQEDKFSTHALFLSESLYLRNHTLLL